jgi:NitT/TauT family transport system substrate-binding protein
MKQSKEESRMHPGNRIAAALTCLALSGITLAACTAAHEPAATEPVTVKLAPMPGVAHMIPQLALALGYFKDEGLDVQVMNVMDFHDVDWRSTELLNTGQIDAEICWFHRIVYGNGNGSPARAVMLFQDAPDMMLLVANRMQDVIRSAADFKGRNVSDGAGFSTKSFLTNRLAMNAGLPEHSYRQVAIDSAGRLQAIVEGLNSGAVDVITSMDPLTSQLLETGQVTPLYDLTTAEGTRDALGDVWPTRALYLAPDYIAAHPETVQHLVNAFVRTMRFINSHTADEIADALPTEYFGLHVSNHDWREHKAAKIDEIRRALPSFAGGDYSVPPSAARLLTEVVMASSFDDSDEGQYRLSAKQGDTDPEHTYDNRFVRKAMEEIR